MGKLILIGGTKDEEPGFKPSVDYVDKIQKCRLAYEELIQHKDVIINKAIYLPWLKKHKELFEFLNLNPYAYHNLYMFYSLYMKIDELKGFLKANDAAIEAIRQFQTVDVNNEADLIKWSTEFERIGGLLTPFQYKEIDLEYPQRNSFFKLLDLKISVQDFYNVAKFKFVFDKYYWPLLNKYSTFAEEVRTHYRSEKVPLEADVCFLSYHLNERGIKI